MGAERNAFRIGELLGQRRGSRVEPRITSIKESMGGERFTEAILGFWRDAKVGEVEERILKVEGQLPHSLPLFQPVFCL